MSYGSWTEYGYGINVTELEEKMIKFFTSIDENENKQIDDNRIMRRIYNLLSLNDEVRKEVETWIDDNLAEDYIYYDFREFTTDNSTFGLASILQKLIIKNDNLKFEIVEDYNGTEYLILLPFYPWQQMTEEERRSNPDNLTELFNVFSEILYDGEIDVDYQTIYCGN